MLLKKLPLAILSLGLLLPRAARACDEAKSPWCFQTGVHYAYLLAGGSSRPGSRAPATGGVALVPTVRVLHARRVGDPYVSVAPILVTPYSLDALGFVGALDLGVSWHPDGRAWHVGTALTIAPAYMRFCNGAPWCLKEAALLSGIEIHYAGDLFRTDDGGGLSATFSLRMLTVLPGWEPVAWTYSRLTPEEADVHRSSGMGTAGLLWRW